MDSLPKPTQATVVRDLGRAFVTAHYPDELPYFPMVCDCLKRRTTGKVSTETLAELSTGLGFSAEAVIPLATPFILLTLEASLHELSIRGHLPDLDKIKEAIRGAAEAFGAPEKLVSELVESLGPKLRAAFQEANFGAILTEQTAGSSGVPHRDPSPVETDRLFIDRVVDGHRRKCGWANSRVRPENRKNSNYDILIDEIALDVLVRENRATDPTGPPRIVSIPRMDRGAALMLWLALKNFGRHVSYREIEASLNRRDVHDNGIHQTKNALRKLLGADLQNRLVGQASNRRYPVTHDAVNYCWMRRDSDYSTSELRLRVVQPDEPTTG